MTNMRCRLIVICALVGSLSPDARAAENGFYVGAASGEAKTDDDVGLGDAYDDRDSSYKIIGGWRIFDWFGVEGGYFDLGEVALQQPVASVPPFMIEQDGWNAFSMFLIEMATFDLFGKLGIVRSSADLTTSVPGGQTSSVDRDTDLAWGFGGQLRFGKIAFRMEYEHLKISNGDGLEAPNVVSVGVTWTF
jgi:OOP family OmpA-OmpF porin